MTTSPVEGVDEVPVADPVRRLESARLGHEEPAAFEAVHLEVDHCFDLSTWAKAFATLTPPGGEWGHHHKASALIDVESARDETMRQQPREALAVRGMATELGMRPKSRWT